MSSTLPQGFLYKQCTSLQTPVNDTVLKAKVITWYSSQVRRHCWMLGIFEKHVTHLQTQTHLPSIALENVNLYIYLFRGLPALLWVAGVLWLTKVSTATFWAIHQGWQQCQRHENSSSHLLKPGVTISHTGEIKPLKLEQTDHGCCVLCMRTNPSLLI